MRAGRGGEAVSGEAKRVKAARDLAALRARWATDSALCVHRGFESSKCWYAPGVRLCHPDNCPLLGDGLPVPMREVKP